MAFCSKIGDEKTDRILRPYVCHSAYQYLQGSEELPGIEDRCFQARICANEQDDVRLLEAHD